MLTLSFSFSHASHIDSLEAELKKDLSDTARVNRLAALCTQYRLIGKIEKSMQYGKEGIALAEKLSFVPGIAKCLHNVGNIYLVTGEYRTALDYYKREIQYWETLLNSPEKEEKFLAKKGIAAAYGNMGLAFQYQSDNKTSLEYQMKCLKIREEINDEKGMATALGNIGLLYQALADYSKALDYQLKSLKMEEKIKNDIGIARVLGNIGLIYTQLGESSKALEYQFRCLAIVEKANYKEFISKTLSNIGTIYFDISDFLKALEYQKKCISISIEVGDKRAMAVALNNIGTIYANLPDSICRKININPAEKYDMAMDYQQQAKTISEQTGEKQNLSTVYSAIADIFLKKKKYAEAIKAGEKAYTYATEAGDQFTKKEIFRILYSAYKSLNNIKEALNYYEKYVHLRDSLFKEENKKEIIRKQIDYEYEKKETMLKAEQEKERELATAEMKRQKLFTWLVTAVAIAVASITFIVILSLRSVRNQKIEIEKQKNLVDEKNRQITDSINYAKRIQDSFLLSEEEIAKYIPYETFVLYQPKDIVSGDFYWMGSVKNSNIEYVVIAAADCTGHGVPGAFLSMIGHMLLNEIVNQKKIINPSDILYELHENMHDTLHRETIEHSQDGMDISICVFEKEKNILRYSGACSPVYLVYKEENSFRLESLKPDVLSVGDKTHFNADNFSFTSYEVLLKPGMRIYLFSDGFMDQINRKMKQRIGSSQFKKLLTNSAHLPMQEQKEFLKKYFSEWMASDKQMDDVLVIGVQV